MYDPGPEKLSDDCISLHRNENLFVNQQFLQNLISEANKSTNFSSYPDSMSYNLRKEIAIYHSCSPEEVYIGNGADGVLSDVLSLLREYYDEVGLQDLTYRVYPYLCARYKYQQRLLSETRQLWIIDSPNSLTAEAFDFSSITQYPETLVWDNVYGEFDPDNSSCIPRGNEVIRVHSFSKFFALASLRVGYCIGSAKLISSLLERKDVFNVNAIAQNAAVLALKNENYFRSLVLNMFTAKQALIEGLTDLGFFVTQGKANFIWTTHPYINMKSLQKSLANAGILVRHFSEPHTESYLRITIPPQDIVKKLLTSLSKIINNRDY